MSLPYRGGGILMPFNDKPHLFAIMNDECRDGQCLVIMLTTVHRGRYFDQTCIVNAGEHPFVQHESYLLYRKAETPRAQHVRNMLSKGYFRPKDDFSTALFDRIALGIYDSDETTPRIIRYADSVALR